MPDAQYTSMDFTAALRAHGIHASLGSVGDAYDTQSRMPILDAVGWGLTPAYDWASRQGCARVHWR
jgi:hypothetical protein